MSNFRDYHDELLAEQWSAKYKDIIQMWGNIPNNQPIQMNPIDIDHKGTRFDEDGIRITGTPKFIATVLSRIKDLLNFNKNPSLKLDISYRQITSKRRDSHNVSKYACYIHLSRKPIKFDN